MILILLLLAELLVPVNKFCKFLQTRNVNYSLVMTKFKHMISQLKNIKTYLQHHDALDCKLKYFKLASEYLKFAAEATDLGRSTRSKAGEVPVKERIDKFVTQLGQPLTNDLIDEITGAMEETSPVLSGFDLFNPDCFDKSTETRQEHFEVLVNHYGTSTTDDFENDVTKMLPLSNYDSALTEYDGFMESFDASVEVLNEKL